MLTKIDNKRQKVGWLIQVNMNKVCTPTCYRSKKVTHISVCIWAIDKPTGQHESVCPVRTGNMAVIHLV